ncbi:MAG TPA: HAD family hydrolase [Polyangiaceae bacterium]|nr:HAD family hydrolase [Polyangiaceae bacterium]
MRPTILLFDIDGTLLTTGHAGRRAMERAFARYGDPEVCRFRFDGMTDKQIARQALVKLGLDPTDAAIDESLALYLELLIDEVERADAASYRLHDGIREALDAARARSHGIGLGTGNVVEGARIKLSRVGVYEEFAFGGFGSDAEDRTELLRHGAERGAKHVGAPLSECRVVVIGDTPKDVAAARGIGAECIGVGTGSFTPAALLECGATAAFASLSAPGALEALLGE